MKKIWVPTMIAMMIMGSLANSALAASPGVDVNLPLAGSLQAQEMYTPDPSGVMIHVNGNGSGNATQLGLYAINYQVDVNPLTGAGSNASAHLIAANGDSLFAVGSGQSSPSQTPDIFDVVETYTITGGTGRFENATGSFTVKRQLSTVTGATSGSLSGTIEIH
jgi:hypothetical protein